MRPTVRFPASKQIPFAANCCGAAFRQAFLANLWQFDCAYGSVYEVADGIFTGGILTRTGEVGKNELAAAPAVNPSL